MTGRTAKISLALTILALLGLLLPASAGEQVPFKGRLVAQAVSVTPVPNSSLLLVILSITGQATHLGAFTGASTVTFNVATGHGLGMMSWTAADGDNLFLTIEESPTPGPTPDLVDLHNLFTITGGTGRFAGATGEAVSTGQLDLSTGVETQSFEGTISSVGSNGK